MSPEKHCILREAEEILGIKIRTARAWVHDGKLNAVKYGDSNRLYVPESEIIRKQSEERA